MAGPTMTGYKTKTKYPFQNRNYGPTPVDIYWSVQYNAYACKWKNTAHFAEMTPIINYFKAQPYGDCIYDPDNKVWYFMEKYLDQVKILLNAFGPTIFTINFQQKPDFTNQFLASKIPSTDDLFLRFEKLTDYRIKDLEYNDAKKIYRKVCLLYHPDRNPGNEEVAKKMSDVNEIWTNLETVFYKTRVVKYEQKEP